VQRPGVSHDNRRTRRCVSIHPLHPGLHLERIVNDDSAWAIRVDSRFRISLDPEGYLTSGDPDWAKPILLPRILDHDDLYKHPR
jgi:hypothetical protein